MKKLKKRQKRKKLTTKSIIKVCAGLLVIVGAFFVFWSAKKSQAGDITNMSISTSGTTYTIILTPSTTIPAGGKINVSFQWHNSDRTTVPEGVTLGAGSSAAISSLSRSSDGFNIIAAVGSEISGGTEVTIVAEGLTNPTTTNRYWALFWTQNDSSIILDGSGSSTSAYRAYYTIGTPIAMGRVLNPSGNPANNVWVDLHVNSYSSSPIYGGDSTDDLGYYSIGSVSGTLSSGTTVKMAAFAPGDNYSWGMTDEVSLTYEGATINRNFQFTTPTKTISGTVKDSSGSPIANARVNFWKMNGSGYTEATTNSSGSYSALVKGGQWCGNPQASSGSDNWSYGQPPSCTTFQNNTTAESQAVNFTVQLANSTIAGAVRLPDGSIPSNTQNFWIGAYAMMSGANGELQADGSFSIKVPAGTYKFEVMDMNQNYAAPEIVPITVTENQTYNLGTVTLISRNATISGRAVDTSGNGIADQRISTYMMKGGGWAEDTTDANGNFSLKVFPGKWMLQVSFWSGEGNSSSYVLNGNPEVVKVGSGETINVTVELAQTSATINGSVVDTNGAVISDMYGWVYADRAGSESFHGPGLGGSVDKGRFSFNVPPGTYNVGFGTMPGSDYSSGGSAQVIVADGQTATQNITAYPNDMTISGTIKDEDDNTVTGVFLEVFATNDTGGWQNAMINQSDGTYSMSVASAVDPWSVGYYVDPSSGYFSQTLTNNSASGDAGDTVTRNITIRRADATITGTVFDGDGNPMDGAFVFADNRSGSQDRQKAEFMGPMFMENNMTGLDGSFTLRVPNGTYYVGASVPREQYPELINPERVQAVVGKNETASVNLSFLKADATISGAVTLNGAGQDEAFVWAWSEEGGYNEAETDSDGNYTLNVTKNDTWHMGVDSDMVDSTDYVTSTELVIETGNQSSVDQDIEMETVSGGLVEPVSTTFAATSPKAANLSDGTRVTVPANALATSGNVTLNASTTSELPRTTNAKPIDTGLDLTASNSSGNSITSFNSSVTIAIPYDESALDDLRITEDDLVAAYWDETNGIWQPLENYSIDKENNKVVMSTSHFTTFAVVSDSVTSGETVSTGTKAVIDGWKAERFWTLAQKAKEKLKLVIHGRRFENDADVTIGGKSADSVKATVNGRKIVAKFTWDDLVGNKYNSRRVVRVINPSADSERANEKINLDKVPIRVDSNVFDDDTEEGIINVQTVLFNRGYLGEKDITGIYNNPTQQAVKEFQADNGIEPVGVVGPQTRAKLIEKSDNL